MLRPYLRTVGRNGKEVQRAVRKIDAGVPVSRPERGLRGPNDHAAEAVGHAVWCDGLVALVTGMAAG